MDYYVSYSTQAAPLDHGAIIVDNSYLVMNAMLKWLDFVITAGLSIIIILLVIYLLVNTYNKCKKIVFLIKDTNEKVTSIENMLKKAYQTQNIKSIEEATCIINNKEKETMKSENVFIVDESGVVTTNNNEDKDNFMVEIDSIK